MNPNLLGRRFAGLWERLGARGNPQPVWQQLQSAYQEPHRHYHTLEHLEDCLAQLDAAPSDGTERESVEAAIWFHDAVYDPKGMDNEGRSADLAQRALLDAAVAPSLASEVARLVLLTRHAEPPSDPAGKLLCDVDLSILGRDPAVFDRYEQAVRAEFSWVPESVFRAERAAVLARLLRRRSLYQTAYFRQRYEDQARRNLARSLAALAGGQAREPPADRR